MQFLAEAIKKADSTESDKVAKALLGLTSRRRWAR